MNAGTVLLAELKAALPCSYSGLVHKNSTAYANCKQAALSLIMLSVEDMDICDLFTSPCGRFDVDPMTHYRVPAALAQRIWDYNFKN